MTITEKEREGQDRKMTVDGMVREKDETCEHDHGILEKRDCLEIAL